jgi:hypothetical protein
MRTHTKETEKDVIASSPLALKNNDIGGRYYRHPYFNTADAPTLNSNKGTHNTRTPTLSTTEGRKIARDSRNAKTRCTNKPAGGPLMQNTIITELGVERLCTKCAEYWPNDAQFFYLKFDKPQQPCKACFAELPSRLARKKLNKK